MKVEYAGYWSDMKEGAYPKKKKDMQEVAFLAGWDLKLDGWDYDF